MTRFFYVLGNNAVCSNIFITTSLKSRPVLRFDIKLYEKTSGSDDESL